MRADFMEGMVHSVDDAPRPQKETGFDSRLGRQVEKAGSIRPHPQSQHHIS